MPLRDAQRLALEGLLKECSAHVVADAGRGTGFFVDDRHLLTSAHVVGAQEGAEVTVQPYQRAIRPGTVIAVEAELADDLALVEVKQDGEEKPQPAVVFEPGGIADGGRYFAVGYPSGELVQDIGIEGITYTGHARVPAAGGTATLLILEEGQAAVTSGMSGGPVLNAETGAVVAVMQYSKNTEADMGGGAIPVSRAAAAFKAVEEVIAEPPTAASRWRKVLGADAWQALGYRWGWNRMLEVRISGTRDGWKVQVDPDDEAPREVTTEGLPQDVFRALFSWAERRHVHDAEEVSLLGRLLAGAVFPSEAASKVLSDRLHDELLLRLHFDPTDSDLFDVPWEFVTVRSGEEDRHLAADENMGLVRVGRHPDPGEVTTAPYHGDAQVVGVVIEPYEYQQSMPRLPDAGWPSVGEILKSQQKAVESSRGLRCVGLGNPTSLDVSDRLEAESDEGASIEVVHYIGFGRVDNGRPQIAFSDGEDGVYWRPAGDFFKWVASSGARLLVVEFVLPPLAMEFEALPPKTFLGALSKRVNAVVFTRFPVHPKELNMFNTTLYAALGEGKAVETAVQLARQRVDRLRALGDAAVFGTFSLITGERADMRLVPVEVSSPVETTAAQERGSPRRRFEDARAPAETTFVGGRQ